MKYSEAVKKNAPVIGLETHEEQTTTPTLY